MFLHIGENKTVRKADIVGIFDSDTATVSKTTKKFLSDAEKGGRLEVVGGLPKSFTLTTENKTEKIYFSQLSSKTLAGRTLNDGTDHERKRKNG